jgi:hypothetical protein
MIDNVSIHAEVSVYPIVCEVTLDMDKKQAWGFLQGQSRFHDEKPIPFSITSAKILLYYGSSAGGHFNPSGMPHSAPVGEKRHEGDMGKIVADTYVNAHLEYIDPVLKLIVIYSIVDRAIIVHEKEDDDTTQPTGNAGARIGYGVIGIAK